LIDRLRRRINYIAATDYNVLILGESGSGKETTAWAIHELSSRRDKPFLAVNCAGFSDDLLESEMFGYVKGSHSQAFDSQLGLLDIVDGGTLFLDELPDMGQRVQAKLLRCLETGEFRPLGGNENRYSDVRIIAAGQTALVGDPKRLRTDLKSRLGQLEVTVHPLREHERYYPGTISKLAYVLLERYTWTTVFRDGIRYELNPVDIKTYQHRLEDPSIKSRLASSSWRESNIRELNNFLRRWIVFGDDEFSLLNGYPYSESEIETSGRLPHQLDGEDLAAYILLPSSRQELQMFFTHHPFHDVKKAYMSYLFKVFSQIVEEENQRTGLAIKPTQKALAAVLGLTENTVSRYKQ
jgi:transcriptional regulator with PAS, ATPase and Fis domain